MSSRTRLVVMSISAPVIAFALIGGFLGKVIAREDTFQHLKPFDDVVNFIASNYVEDVSIDKVMQGALRGLADGLDPDSAFLSPEQVKELEAGKALPAGDVGLELTRQYYLRVIAARDDSPAAKAGLRTGDYVRAIDDKPTREMSVWEGMRALRGAPGTKVTLAIIRGSAADPHIIELTRTTLPASDVSSRMAANEVGYLRVAAIGPNTVNQAKTQIDDLQKKGAASLIVDVRRTSTGDADQGLTLARLFVNQGTLAIRERGAAVGRESIEAVAGDGAVKMPVLLLVDGGTSGASELFASALSGNKRADLIGEHTIGRAAIQRLIKLPDNSGLWLSTARYLTPQGSPLHERGLEPTVAVPEPDVEFGQSPPPGDAILEKALERLAEKKAA
ncbi:MAG TPA: S41 family peptidase [Vicinamibacterales bacterium]|nr:S41 family peptidase [Vicinamibacterales bacterium]